MHIIYKDNNNTNTNISFKGKIPLRELVYRVLDLPPSMQPLVYDFGQLNTDTEKDYTRQIVSDHVRDEHYVHVYTTCAISYHLSIFLLAR